ncbi:4-hydroxy-tetrahydrodipicolinate reductase [Paraglaciecola aestuariivivens]
MSRIAIIGASGRMGRMLINAIEQSPDNQLSAASVRACSSLVGVDVGELAGIGAKGQTLCCDLTDYVDITEVLIDFTLPAALTDNLAFAVKHKLPIVIGTTGLNAEQKLSLEQASQQIPIVFAANYSVGVNLMLNLVRQAAKVMADTADIEIIETHHRFKQDAPSGTALAIGEAIADEIGRDLSSCAVYGREGHTGERAHSTIGFATIRAGDVVGDHTALFADLGENIEISHKATSRLTFAKGALKAANWLIGKPPGLYDMQDVLGFK